MHVCTLSAARQQDQRAQAVTLPSRHSPPVPLLFPPSAPTRHPQLSRSSTHVLDMLSCQSWGALAYRAWKLYVLGSSVVGAAQAGAAGLRAGFGMGKTLVSAVAGGRRRDGWGGGGGWGLQA